MKVDFKKFWIFLYTGKFKKNKIFKIRTDNLPERKQIKKILMMTVGLPRSGKSTWAKEQNCPIVNPDSIRLAIYGQRFCAKAEPFVWATAFIMTEALFKAGHSIVILDATNTNEDRRKEWERRFPEEKYRIILKKFNTSKETCIQRAIDTNQEDLIPVIERMAEELELEL